MDAVSLLLMFTKLNEVSMSQILLAVATYLLHTYRSNIEAAVNSWLTPKPPKVEEKKKKTSEFTFQLTYHPTDMPGQNQGISCNIATSFASILWVMLNDKEAVAQITSTFNMIVNSSVWLKAFSEDHAKKNSISGQGRFYRSVHMPEDGTVIHLKNGLTFTVEKTVVQEKKLSKLVSLSSPSENECLEKTYSHFIYKVHVSSMTLTMDESLEIMDAYAKDYVNWFKSILQYERFIHFNCASKGNTKPQFTSVPFDSTKTFDNMFFEGKTELVKRIDTYMDNISLYKRLGIPHTLGLLLYGEPGCGKTSVIKAVANHMKRSIINVNLKWFKSAYALQQMFHKPGAYDIDERPDKVIYVFEEIDCSTTDYESNPFLSREYVASMKKAEAKQAAAAPVHPIVGKVVDDELPTGDYISTGELLEILDGITECKDRIIILTTNHVDLLDKAFLRPGRIDMCMHFKKLRKVDVDDLFKLWFGRRIHKSVYDKIKDYMLTQAEMGKLCFKHKDSPSDLETELLSL